MFWTINKAFLITCLIVLDVLLIIDIQNKKAHFVTIIENPKTYTITEGKTTNVGSAKITIPKLRITEVPTPTPAPTQTPTPTPGVAVTQNDTRSDLGLASNQGPSLTGNLLGQINSYRNSKGLSQMSADPNTCAFANNRANEIASEFNHDGFTNRVSSKSLPYPSYTEVTENIAMNSDPNAVVPGWIASPGHNENLLKNTSHACIGNSGEYYAYESWRP